jgi:hypothetical protein
MKLAPEPTLIIVASSKELIQVEHDDSRFRERTAYLTQIHHRSFSEPKGQTQLTLVPSPTHSHAKFFLIWFIAAKWTDITLILR